MHRMFVKETRAPACILRLTEQHRSYFLIYLSNTDISIMSICDIFSGGGISRFGMTVNWRISSLLFLCSRFCVSFVFICNICGHFHFLDFCGLILVESSLLCPFCFNCVNFLTLLVFLSNWNSSRVKHVRYA